MMAGGVTVTVTEDTPPDMLAGHMDLAVVLPDGHSLKMSVERSTPMMDLLVQVTTANKISPAGYILKPHNERGPLPYKPSTPIGALDAWTIHVVPKQLGQCPAIKRPLKLLNQPFEQTFRLQVHLPRNQLYVARVSPKTRLSDILLQVCSEKNLDPLKYSLRHPINLDQVLSLHYTLGDYKLQELALVCNKTRPVEVSSVDIMSLQRDSANPAYRNTKCEGSVSSGSLEGRSLSPVPSDESSASPPPLTLPPSRPIRKRRPAPKPPTHVQKQVNNATQLTISEKQVNGIQPPTVINHSRNSSDSSGYHEASVLSESPQNNSVPEGRKVAEAPLTVTLSQSMTDVSALQSRPLQQSTSCNSISSLSSATGSATGRKKKTAPPPPPVTKDGATANTVRSPSVSSTASSTTTLDGNEANTAVKSATLPPSTRLNTAHIPPPPPLCPPPPPTSSPLPPASPPVAIEPPTTPRVAPPVPRPRSMLLSDSNPANLHKPASPKKLPAPKPKPRQVPKPVETDCEKSDSTTKEKLKNVNEKKKHPFMRKILPSSFFNSHKACVEELASKFDSDVKIDENKTEPERRIGNASTDNGEVLKIDSSHTEVESSLGGNESAKGNEDEGETAGCQPDAAGSSAVVGANPEPDADLRLADEEIDRIFSKATENHSSPENEEDASSMMSLPSPVTSQTAQNPTSEDQLDWEYRLPAPPTFRDETKSPSVTEFGTVTIGNLSDVVCSQPVKEHQSEVVSESQSGVDVETTETENQDDMGVKNTDGVQPSPNTDCIDDPLMRPLRKEIRSSSASSIYESEALKSSRGSVHSIEQEVINELTSTLPNRPRANLSDIEAKQSKVDLSSRNTLDNFTITTYKDTKPVEVFEDDSIKSSAGEKRDKSKDDAVFRAPKPRVKEPNLSRTSSFSIEANPSGPVIKRSVSYVSLLAANMPRHSQPYRAHLQRHRSSVGQELDSFTTLRKTSSEVNIDKQDRGRDSLWNDDTTQLQSVQVLRNILSRSQANLSSSIEETEDSIQPQRESPIPMQDHAEKNSTESWGRTQSEDLSDQWKTPRPIIEHSASVGEEPPKQSYAARGPPSINLSTWSERPKRQVSIKNDGEYISGFGKKPTLQESLPGSEKKEESPTLIKPVASKPSPPKNHYVHPVENEGYKLDGKSKSVTDLSRIPIVRSVELKKTFAGHSFDQPRLRHVEMRDNSKKNSEAEDFSKQNGDEGFIGVDSLARRFGVPQKRPVSEYFGTVKFNELANSVGSANRSTLHSVPTSDNVSSTGNNTSRRSYQSDTRNGINSNTDCTTDVKTQSKIRSGGFFEKSTSISTSGLKRTISQPSHINSLSLIEPSHTSHINVKPSNVSSVSIYSGAGHKISPSSIYIKQSQTLDRKFPVSLQPVVKGFRVPTDINTNSTQTSSTRETANTITSQPIMLSSKNTTNTNTLQYTASSTSNKDENSSTSTTPKPSYNRTFSTPSVSITSTKMKETAKDNSVTNVRLRSSSSSISQAKAEISASIPPPPPMMPVLKPVGQRKGVNFLPPPTADPRDMLMESIRAFGKDSLKKVSSGVKL